MLVHRVHLWHADAKPSEPYSAEFIPPQQGYGRWDNPDLYTLRYLATSPEGAIIEAFGSHAIWREDMFRTGDSSHTIRALSTFDLPEDTVFADLSDPRLLIEYNVTVTEVVKRNPRATQRLAARLFQSHEFDGIAWWSYYQPSLTLIALFQPDEAQLVDTVPLSLDLSEVQEAARLVVRTIE